MFTVSVTQDDDLRLERTAPSDAPQVWAIQRAAFQEYLGVQNPPPSVWRADVAEVERWLRDGGGVLAWLGDTLVGSVVWSYRDPVFYVQHVAVHPDYRRRGLASRMMGWIESEAQRSGYSQIALRFRSVLKGNQALYESLGFALADTAPHPLGGPETLTRMEKRLARA